tara:strand:+ start:3445 stop:4284 length:840 start_codon:yes stop_codon:yes gene_type:complete
MRKRYKGGNKLADAKDRVETVRSDVLRSDTWWQQILEIFAYFIIFCTLLDFILILPINAMFYQGPGMCVTKDWKYFGIFTPISWTVQNFGTKCSDVPDTDDIGSDGKCKGGLGRWDKYDRSDTGNKKGFLCAGEATQIYNDSLSDNKMAGYTGTQILAYIIVPTLTVLGIIYGLVFSRLNYSEWIFWILITTLIYTGTRSIAESTDIQILPPDQPSPLAYITKKLKFKDSDELQYNFMARMSNGSTCLVEGVMLGGGIHSSEGAPSYTGDCTSESLPLN